MLYNRCILKASCLACLLISAAPVSVADDLDNLLELSFEELLQVTISVAAPSTERIIETPAVVSRYDVEDMSSMGLRTLKDMLSFIPGFVLQDSRSGGTTVMVRGLVEGFNQKVLFMIDGTPYWMPSHSEIPLLGMPIEAISHIEVIRGPGTVIYGSNASAGVINVITKHTEESIAAVSVGSNQKVNGGGYFHQKLTGDSFFSVALEAQTDEGYEGEFKNVSQPGFFPPDISDDGTATKSEELKSVLIKYQKGNFNVLGQAFQTLINHADEPSPLVISRDLEHSGYLLHVDNTWNFDNTELKLFSDFNRFSLTFKSDNLFGVGVDGGFRFSDNGEDNYRWRSGGSVFHQSSDSLSFFGGFEFERRQIEDYFAYSQASDENVVKLIDAQHTLERTLYGQADYSVGKWRFLVGGRYTNNNQSGDKTTPRLSAVYKLDHNQSLKLLYSVGFNTPNFTQTRINAPGVLQGNPDLKAEVVKTLDFAYSYETNNNLFVANAYYLEADNFIQRKLEGGLINFFNTNKFERYGLELDYQRATNDYLLFANLSYVFQGDDTSKNDIISPFVPKITSAIGASYNITEQQTTGMSLRATGQHNKAPSTYQLNLDYGYRQNQFELFFSVRNILDEELIATDIVDLSDDQLIPNGDGINILAGIKHYF